MRRSDWGILSHSHTNSALEARFANGYCSRVGGERLGVGLSYVLALWAMYG